MRALSVVVGLVSRSVRQFLADRLDFGYPGGVDAPRYNEVTGFWEVADCEATSWDAADSVAGVLRHRR